MQHSAQSHDDRLQDTNLIGVMHRLGLEHRVDTGHRTHGSAPTAPLLQASLHAAL